MPLNKDINKTIEEFKTLLRANESFDLIYRTININSKTACFFFIDGLVKDAVMEKMLEFLYSQKNDDYFKDVYSFSKHCVPYVEVDITGDKEKICTNILSGMLVLMVDGFDKAIVIDVRTYPQRDTSEPSTDRVLRGSRDGFVETLVSNTALIRRRIRNAGLTMKIFSVGKMSKSDVVVGYMDNKVDKKLLKDICDRIKNAKVDSLTMNQQSLIEAIYHYKWYNPFPKIKHTERPDTAASAILEGNIVILVDNSPSAIILPTSIFDILEEADDYYFPPFTGTYLKISRYIIGLFTLIITPLWLLLLQNPWMIPEWLSFIKISKEINLPIFWQLLALELIIDGLRLASLHTPDAISTTLSIIAAIVLSDFAVESGWFNSESMLYMAFVAMANYAQPSIELGYCLKFLRVLLLILTAIFNIWGFFGGLVLIFFMMLFNKTVSGKHYLYPLIPFNGKKLITKVLRTRAKVSE